MRLADVDGWFLQSDVSDSRFRVLGFGDRVATEVANQTPSGVEKHTHIRHNEKTYMHININININIYICSLSPCHHINSA